MAPAPPAADANGGRPSAIIIGAGIGGLTAAFRLQQKGWNVRILERSDVAGGRMRTRRENGFAFDVGAGILPHSYKAVLKLIRDAGLQSLIDEIGGTVAIPRDGKLHYLDMSNLKLSLLKTPLISWFSKLKMLRLTYDLMRAGGTLGYDSIADAARFDSGTAAAYGARHLTPELLDYVVGPTIRTLFLNGLDETSIIEFFWSMKNLSSNSSFCLKGGMDQLAVQLAARLPVTYGAVVEDVTEAGGQAVVTVTGPDGVRRIERTDVAIVAADGKVVAGLCRSILSQTQLAYLSNMRYSTSVNLHFGLRVAPDITALIVQVPHPVDPYLCALVQDHLKGAGRAAAGKGLVSAFFDDAWGRRMANASDAEIFADAIPRIEKIIPGFAGLIETRHAERWPVAATITTTGQCADIKRFESAEKPDRRIFLASDLFAPSSVNTCVTQGERAAASACAAVNA